ncbi:unnamed protein product [Natator depressus]
MVHGVEPGEPAAHSPHQGTPPADSPPPLAVAQGRAGRVGQAEPGSKLSQCRDQMPWQRGPKAQCTQQGPGEELPAQLKAAGRGGPQPGGRGAFTGEAVTPALCVGGALPWAGVELRLWGSTADGVLVGAPLQECQSFEWGRRHHQPLRNAQLVASPGGRGGSGSPSFCWQPEPLWAICGTLMAGYYGTLLLLCFGYRNCGAAPRELRCKPLRLAPVAHRWACWLSSAGRSIDAECHWAELGLCGGPAG